MPKKYDFAGWVTKNDTLCSDGVVIKHDAFADNDQATVPLVWEHNHDNPTNVLGHVILHNQDKGVYGYGYFNDTPEAEHAKELIQHGDISAMSIAANKIKKRGQDVIHGRIFEVSLVLAGANPGALIESIVQHGDTSDNEAIIYTGNLLHSADDVLEDDLIHSEGDSKVDNEENKNEGTESAPTVEEVFNTLTDIQKAAVDTVIETAIEQQDDSSSENEDGVQQSVQQNTNYDGDDTMKHNVFDNESNNQEDILTHSQQEEIIADAKNLGKLSDAYLQHSITNIETLFPDYKSVTNAPVIYRDQNTSAEEIVNAVTKSPFSRVKTMYADFTKEEARARGYIKGKEKLEQIYEILHRTTDPQTVYKKQKLDRDDVVDITDFDIVAFTNKEMRFMLNEEIARATLVGDGREVTDESKIKEANIRPILTDDDLYTIKVECPSVAELLETIIKSLAKYKGSGNPSMYMDPVLLAEFRLLKDSTGRFLFGDVPSVESMASRIGVAKIVPTTFMSGKGALIVNLRDYTYGATKGGEVTSFDDFDIDFNQYKYLIETRLSGALTTPKSAIAISITGTVPPVPGS